MKFIKTKIEGLTIIEPKIHGDNRGYFLETYNKEIFDENIGEVNFVQDNESKSKYGILRGLHFQKPPFEQAKLVRCVSGEVLDVAVDLRVNSLTYGKYVSVLLSEQNKKQFYIPRGFAHGFIVLTHEATFSYKVDNIYSPNHDSGIIWNDNDLSIDWGIPTKQIKTSEKDKELQKFYNFNSPFITL